MNVRAKLGLGAVVLAAAAGACSSRGSGDTMAASAASGTDVGTTGDGKSHGAGQQGATATTTATGTQYGAGGAGSGGAGQGGSSAVAPSGGGGGVAPACAGLEHDKPVTLFLSADDSSSMGSPAYARELLREGVAPFAGIRTYEFLNYYRIAYAPPPSPNLALLPELEPGEGPGLVNLQIGVRSFDAIHPRRPMTLTFVLDTSGSMGGQGIERERAAVKAIAAELAAGDVVSMVLWNDSQSVVLDGHAASGPNDPLVVGAADSLEADGSTDLHSGLVTGYGLAQKYYGDKRLNRVILISDGGANVGVTDAALIGDNAKDADKEGIYLVGIGAGPADQYDDGLMNTVTDAGRGAYVYLDGPAEAARVLGERFDEIMEIAARGVQVELDLPWYLQMQAFHGEQYSSNPKEVEPQHLAPSSAMIFDQTLAACDPAVVKGDDPVTITARWETPITRQKMQTSITRTVSQLLDGPKDHLAKGKAIVAYAEALKAGTADALHAARALADAANPNGNDPDLTEIAGLIAKHPAY
jgi:Ca-activated chloride channel family protein